MADTVQDVATHLVDEVSSAARGQADAYLGDQALPLGGFMGAMAVYASVVAAGAVAVRRKGLPDRIGWSDVALLSVATHKLSRRVAKDSVTSPLRVPFTRFVGTGGPAELQEEVRGSGARKAIGELLSCPFCLGQWVATGLAFGFVLAPRATRLVATVFTAAAASDILQFVYVAAEKRAEDSPITM